MIYVGGVPFSTDHSSSSQVMKGSDMLIALLEHPALVSASSSFSAISERKFSVSAETSLESSTRCKFVYVFQREYATADPALVEFVGTDEATTCVGIVIRNCKNGMTSIAHMDSPGVVETGLAQMLSSVLSESPSEDAVFDVHVVGAFEDATPQHAIRGNSSGGHRPLEGFSVPLCTKIVESLEKSREKLHLQTFHVLKHNTRWDSEGNAYPIFNGLLVETSSGSIVPATFDKSTRCPDEIIRRFRGAASYEDPTWTGRLLETYETRTNRFVIAPATWTTSQLDMALEVRDLSDLEILLTYSSSPMAEGPDFVENIRRTYEYVIQHPDWSEAFPSNKPRVFERRTASGSWTRS